MVSTHGSYPGPATTRQPIKRYLKRGQACTSQRRGATRGQRCTLRVATFITSDGGSHVDPGGQATFVSTGASTLPVAMSYLAPPPHPPPSGTLYSCQWTHRHVKLVCPRAGTSTTTVAAATLTQQRAADAGPKDAPLPSLYPPEPKPPAPVWPRTSRARLFGRRGDAFANHELHVCMQPVCSPQSLSGLLQIR